jgi:hypothetical protein
MHEDYFPSKEVLAQELESLQSGAVYVNHAGFHVGAGSDLIWINVVREPIARWSSMFYYMVDVENRGERAAKELARRKKDARCGCAGLEFFECIEVLVRRDCSLVVPSQIEQFCQPGEECSRELATYRVHTRYRLVGLTEELEVTIKMLERMLPRFFRGAEDMSTQPKSVKKRPTFLANNLTHTSLNGAIPDRTRKLIEAHAVNFKDEHLFYEDTKKLFWQRACKQGVLSLSPPPPRPFRPHATLHAESLKVLAKADPEKRTRKKNQKKEPKP